MNTALKSSTASSAELLLLVQIGLLAGPFLSMLDSNIVNVALPAIAQELHSTLATVQWIVSGYALRESSLVAQVLQAFGLPAGVIKQAAASTTLIALPQALKERLLSAAVGGFHDTIWLLVLLSLLGFGASWLLHDRHT